MAQAAVRGAAPLYRTMAERTQGELYIGVVGPVRAGKSTFITRFMEQLVLPLIPPGARRDRVVDDLPQSGSGRTIMTTQPRFVPSDGAVQVTLPGEATAKIRLVDSVGYLIRGALGTQEGGDARMVSTPWSDSELPFEEAAELGTRRVMAEHAVMGVVVTTDGTVTELPREAYVPAEERVLSHLSALGKPYMIVLNSAQPQSDAARALRDALAQKYDAPVALLSAKEMTEADVQGVVQSLLTAFPLREMRFAMPEWVSALDDGHYLVRHITDAVRAAGQKADKMRAADSVPAAFAASEYITAPHLTRVDYGEGAADYDLELREGLFNRILSEQCGTDIQSDRHLLAMLKELVRAKREYDRVADALREATDTGYGLVTPAMADVELLEPQISRQGGRYGVRLRAKAPTLHLIRSDVEAEVAPVLGSQEQTDDFAATLRDTWARDPAALLSTNFFGRSLESLISDGLTQKLRRMPPDAQDKVRQALQRILNEGDGGMICILL